jgi:Ca2+-binding EF-hand superfamily protein
MTYPLTKAFLTEVKDTFTMIAGEETGFDIIKLPVALQSLGLKMDKDAFRDFENAISVDLNLFLKVICSCKEDPELFILEMKEAFLVLDRGETGYAERNDLKRVLTKLGEPLNDRDIDLQMATKINEQEKEGDENEVYMTVEDWITLCKTAKEDNNTEDSRS